MELGIGTASRQGEFNFWGREKEGKDTTEGPNEHCSRSQ